MTAGILDTIIRMTVDSAQGVASTDKLNTSMGTLSSRGVKTLGEGFGSLATQAIAASGASQALGVQENFLSGTLSMAAQSVGMINPLLLVMTIAGTAAVTMFLNKRKATDDLRESLEKYSSTLEKVAKGDSQYAILAERVLEIRRKLVEQELRQIETKIALASVGLKEAGIWDRLISYLAAGAGTYGVLAAQMANTTVAGDEQTKMLAALLSQWQKTSEALNQHTRSADDVAGSIINLKLKWLDLEEGIASATFSEGEYLVALKELAQSRAGLMREQLALELEDERLTDEEKRQMRLNSGMEVELMLAGIQKKYADYHDKIRKMQADTTVDLSQEFKKREALFGQYVLKTNAQYAVLGSAFMRLIQGQTASHSGFAAFIVQTTGEAVQAMLSTYAAIWAAEAVANAISNPVVAASKAKAAAMAGIGVGIVGALTSAAVGAITARTEDTLSEDELSLTGDSTASSSQRTGRTLVQQGPITLNYHAVLTVQGHVLDITDLHDLFDEWNGEQLRRAGFDTKQRARGNG